MHTVKAVEPEELCEQELYAAVVQRLREGENDVACQGVSLEEAMGGKEHASWLQLDSDSVSDEDLFR